ncbi:TonB-dependent receptor [Novosphingobium beihaiensis]|uniref:TonB-dependent receptor n=1 Tax=Novosphingobium beihaiensis TaxID=2930389 RepID=A0ABT0BS29_9SPHN|nr:TonB-dependent receptor [Novosphingobium beihaiensis]MCJ2187683.1 TonB-dependent receptor [Novosphingobium beihaiensis]
MAKAISKHASSICAQLGLGVSAVAMLAAAQPALAQSSGAGADQSTKDDSALDDTTTQNVIIVSGIRASLETAQALKRNSDTVVDAITAEDIGALPDRSVNEALQRIPGVAITRYASPGDSQHFSVEGSGVVIRGLSYVKGEFNGRDTFSANGGREISFNDVSPELVGSIEVFKNLTADRIEGGISGTVSINTRKPFDSTKQLIYLSVENNYADLAKRSSPSFTGLYSNQWILGDGSRIGVLVSGTYSRLYSRVHSSFVASPVERFNGTRTFNEGSPYESTVTDTFDCGNGLESCYTPVGGGVRAQDFDRKRYGISAALQYASPDDRFIATGQFLRTNGRQTWTEHTIEPNVWYSDVNATFPAAGTNYTFDDRGVFVSGTVTRPGDYHYGNIPGSGGTYGLLGNFMQGGLFTTQSNRGFLNDYTTDDYSLNLRFEANDRLRFSVDGQMVKSKVKNVDTIIDTGTWSNVTVDSSGKIPDVTFSLGDVPDYGGTPDVGAYFSDPNSLYFRDAFANREDNNGTEWAFRGDMEYDLSDDGFLRHLKVGGRYSDRDQTVRTNAYNNWGAPSETWTSGGPQTFASIDPAYYETYSFGNFFRGEASQPPSITALKGNLALNYDAAQELLRQINAAGGGGYTPMEDRDCASIRTYFCPSDIYKNSERTLAGYVRLDFSTDHGDSSFFDGNIGVRYVNTKDVSVGAITMPSVSALLGSYSTVEAFCANADPGQTTPALCTMSAADQAGIVAFANGAAIDQGAKNSFSNWLPSFNLRWHASDKLQFRFAASRAISRPDFSALRNYVSINPSTTSDNTIYFTANAGNPFVKPIEATQLDLTAEWYFSKVGSLTGTVFFKRLGNIIDPNGQSVRTVSNNGATQDVVINGAANLSGHANIKGVEVAWQQTFDFLPGLLKGLGAQASFTYIDPGQIPAGTPTNGEADGSRPAAQVDDLYALLPLPQLSKYNVNAAVFYDLGKFSARAAYSWRSRYLLSTRDCCFPFLPIYSEPTGQLDASLFLTVNDKFKIGLQGSNLLNEVTRTSFALYNNGGTLVRSKRAAFINDRRFSISARLSF